MKGEKHLKVKSKYNEALKLYDNKEYKLAKRACDKILEKNSEHCDTIALKGLILTNMNEKVEGERLIKEALKKEIKNTTVWHFYALFYKQEKNYPQSMRSYKCALMYDPSNAVILRDLTYLQLQLRQNSAFLESAKKALELKSNLMVNWVTYSLANYLVGNYAIAYKSIDSCKTINENSLKDQEKNEIILYEVNILQKQKKFDELVSLLETQKKNVLDKTYYFENLFDGYINLNNLEKAKEISLTLLERNAENINYYFFYLQANGHNYKDFDELLRISDEKLSVEILHIFQSLKDKVKSRILNKLEIAISKGDTFRDYFHKHLMTNTRQCVPSVFFSIKFIYRYQKYKITIITEVLNQYLDKIEKKEIIIHPTTTETLDLSFLPNMDFIRYYAAQHFDYLRDLEKALSLINLAIDQTPSFVEFYMVKSKILKHAFMLSESAVAYDKAKKLDLGDRYLNAKSAKSQVRNDEILKSIATMKEFVRDPLADDYADYIQCLWYEIETANAYLRTNQILQAFRLYNYVLSHFNVFIEDQFDFHNYCLRRYIINDFIKYIEYMDRVIDHNFLLQALFGLQVIYSYIQNNKEKIEEEISKTLKDNPNYKYKEIKIIQTEIENETHKLLKKLQPYTKMEYFHNLCVVDFVKNGKVILALKSLMFLAKNKKSQYFINSLNVFSSYFIENSPKISNLYKEIVLNEFPFLKNNVDTQKEIKNLTEIYSSSVENKVSVEFFHFKEKCLQNNKDLNSFKDSILKLNCTILRSIPFSIYNEIILFINAHFSSEQSLEFKNSFTALTRIKCEPKDIDNNLGFYA